MLFDWFTLVAQLLNFIILIWLLDRFLYRPVLKAIDEREKKIEEELQDASDRQEEARGMIEEWKRRNAEFEEEHDSKLHAAESEAAAKRQELLANARTEYDQLKARLQEALANERESIRQELMRRTSREVVEIARKVLADLADSSLEEKAVDLFCRKLEACPDEQRDRIATLVAESSSGPRIRTVFELSDPERERIAESFARLFGSGRPLAFEQDESLLMGIELLLDGHCVSWNMAAYLKTMQKLAADLLDSEEAATQEVEHAESRS